MFKDQRSNFKADYGQYTTNIPDAFTAGECEWYLMGKKGLP